MLLCLIFRILLLCLPESSLSNIPIALAQGDLSTRSSKFRLGISDYL